MYEQTNKRMKIENPGVGRSLLGPAKKNKITNKAKRN